MRSGFQSIVPLSYLDVLKLTMEHMKNFAKGTIHWAKVWYADLGEEQCMDIAAWIHEIIPMEVAKFKGYYLSDVASKRANIYICCFKPVRY